MRFGLGPLTIEPAGKPHVNVYEEALEQAAAAERWGFDSVWVGEEHFTAANLNSSAAVVAAALAQRTSYARVGLIATLGLSHAIHLAEEAACIDNLANGRTIMGAQLPSPAAAGAWRVPAEEIGARAADDVRVLRLSWGPAPFAYEGGRYRIPARNPVHVEARDYVEVSVQPKPAQLELPLWAFGGADAVALASAAGLPFCAAPWLSLEAARELYAARDGAPGAIVPIAREVVVAPTTEQAHRVAEPALGALYDAYRAIGVPDLPAGWDELAAGRFVVGDAARCIEELQRLRDELGVNYVIARLSYAALPHGDAVEAIELFGSAVVPAFRMQGLPDEILRG